MESAKSARVCVSLLLQFAVVDLPRIGGRGHAEAGPEVYEQELSYGLWREQVGEQFVVDVVRFEHLRPDRTDDCRGFDLFGDPPSKLLKVFVRIPSRP